MSNLKTHCIECGEPKPKKNKTFCGRQCMSDHGVSQETRDKISKTMTGRKYDAVHRANQSRGCIKAYKNGRKVAKPVRSYYNGIKMDCRWEHKFAQRLDALNIKWERGKHLRINYKDNDGKNRFYKPDFFLPMGKGKGVYIEIKSLFTLKRDASNEAKINKLDKVIWIKKTIPNILFLWDENSINEFTKAHIPAKAMSGHPLLHNVN